MSERVVSMNDGGCVALGMFSPAAALAIATSCCSCVNSPICANVFSCFAIHI